ncbi:MAG: cellulase family glycosylhydrolase [Erysipelotrichaceae bacterium]|nr:cellulase family glycosylhydrolase [Erysipelotrichaceae bacterium]
MKEFIGYKRGINFGGWFSQCDNTEKRYDNFIKKEDFRRVARWGMDHVRIPVDYNLFLNDDMSFKESGLKRIEDCLLWAKEYGLNVVLDLHKTVGYSFDDGEKEEGFFSNKKYQDIFVSIWEEFAKRYTKYDNVAFELLNEVTDYQYKDTWNAIARRTVETIRKYSKDIRILIGGYYNNSVSAVKDLDMPYDENIVYNFHCYSPLIFTHQGAYWIKQMDTSFRMPFDSKNAVYDENTKKYIGMDYLDTFSDPDDKIDSTYFENLFKEAIEVAKERGVPLYCGEYGVIDRANDMDSLKWYECISSVFNKYDIGRAAWSYKEMDFGLVDAHYDDVRDDIIKLL